MANLAIKGHLTRGKEVIEILKMLGGRNIYNLTGSKEIWYILSNCTIEHSAYLFEERGFTLEQFEETFPYKVGDKVNYVKYNDECPSTYTIQKMWWNGVTIEYLLDSSGFSALIKDLQPYKEETMEKGIIYDEIDFNRCPCADKVQLILGDDFEIKVEDEKTFVVRKKTQYPKTYEECCDILQLEHTFKFKDLTIDEEKLTDSFIRLKRCRDAYWKIAGDWKPNWTKADERKYCVVNTEGNITKWVQKTTNKILAFPTKEMRDAFYENFKRLIEQCKEFL